MGHAPHAALPVSSWNWPAGQFAHDPVPNFPAVHAAHVDAAAFTAHPLPDLHAVCASSFCHSVSGQFAHADRPACVWRWPAAHAAHAGCAAAACFHPTGQSLHAVLLLSFWYAPAAHAPQLLVPCAACFQPAGHCLHPLQPVFSTYQPVGQSLHEALLASF